MVEEVESTCSRNAVLKMMTEVLESFHDSREGGGGRACRTFHDGQYQLGGHDPKDEFTQKTLSRFIYDETLYLVVMAFL